MNVTNRVNTLAARITGRFRNSFIPGTYRARRDAANQGLSPERPQEHLQIAERDGDRGIW